MRPNAVIEAVIVSSVHEVLWFKASRNTENPPKTLAPLADLMEDFEVGTKAGYAQGNVSLASGEWTFAEALIANVGGTDNDLGSGSRTSRIQTGGYLAMNSDKPNGAGIITLKAAAFSSDAVANRMATFWVEVFDNGATVGPPAYRSSVMTVGSGLQTYTFTVNVSGSIRVKITSQDKSKDFRFNIDDIAISSIGNQAANAYTWTGQGNDGSWSNSANWSPARAVPAPTDVIIFDGTVASPATVSLDFTAPTQLIGQLQLRNLVSVVFLNSGTARALSLDGGVSGDDLTVGAGSVLTLRGGSGAEIVLNVTAGETALINGRVASETTGTGSGAGNRLTGQTPGAIVFEKNSLFEAEAGVTGSPFGSVVANQQAVLFKAGATFRQEGGGSAFGSNQTNPAAVFEIGSTYQFAASGSTPSVSGRTYGTLEISNGNTTLTNMTGSAPLVIQNDLRIGTNVKVGLNLTGGIRIGGNVVVEAGGTLDFAPTSVNTITLNGIREQLLNAPSPIRFGALTTLSLDNAAGVRLQAPIGISGTLNLQKGVLNSSTTNLPTLAATTTVSGGSSSSYVSGPVARQLPVGTTTAQLFPIGKAGNYRPVTLQPIQSDRETLVTVEQQEGKAAPLAFNDAIQHVSRVRRYDISASPALNATQFIGTVTLSFTSDDQVTDPTVTSLVVARTDGTGWNSLGHSASSGTAGIPTGTFVAGTLTSASFMGLGDFQTYTLASTDPDATVNPLPVQLLSFAAERQAATVRIHWATATELNSASFEVQRSATGKDFRTIATLAAQGNSTSRHEYAALDRQPLPGLSYYRLWQLDLDGKEAYSAVVSVAAPGEVRAYPNPVKSALTVELPTAGGRYRIISLLGSVLMAGEMPASMAVLDMTGLPAGLYQLEITTPAGRDIRKIIKQ
ncbi:Por secretion system C-terminal sorting domain-containing protein [Hymenobacter actinosclerus]|uniref:Por secretion system C-terminal sorting domain-containing protein n=2 Tax=Hymenobacter actinosclerus TaxID=82805 RepID=A0A1I0BCZ6_9BACT|nr:Por secretion system C-terminal sorting domain-containing protein [Hymenobacter actinosclerus]